MPSQTFPPRTRGSHVADWERTQKPRPWRNPGRLRGIVLFHLLTWLSFAGGVYCGIMLYVTEGFGRGGIHTLPLLGCLVVFAVSLVTRAALGAATSCPLCHGKLFSAGHSAKHKLSNKLPMLPYRASTILHILFTGRFRCMYCSTPFRVGRSNADGRS